MSETNLSVNLSVADSSCIVPLIPKVDTANNSLQLPVSQLQAY